MVPYHFLGLIQDSGVIVLHDVLGLVNLDVVALSSLLTGGGLDPVGPYRSK